ncbi:MAG TPA: hypothetical protein VMG30_20295 [Acidobacteriota bacterium]|nr:hypothetical protein [Acidobacteriota bacterium]
MFVRRTRVVTGLVLRDLAELFKVEKNKIRRIEAIMTRSPYGMNSGWSSWKDGLSSLARDVTMSGGK